MTAPMQPQTVSTPSGDPSGSRAEPSMAHADPQTVHLRVPALPRFLRVARLTASGLAADLGFSVRELDDLRVVIDELAAAIIEGVPPTAMLDLVFREREGGLEVEGSCTSHTARPPVLDAVARGLLEILADEFTFGAVDEFRSFSFRRAPRPD